MPADKNKGLYFTTIDEAIKEAKKRAQSHYTSYHVYQAARETPNYFCSIKFVAATVLAKVRSDGSVERYDQAKMGDDIESIEEEIQEITQQINEQDEGET